MLAPTSSGCFREGAGEHGVGVGKIAYMSAEHGAAVAVMRSLKSALDPKGILNPGKMLPADDEG